MAYAPSASPALLFAHAGPEARLGDARHGKVRPAKNRSEAAGLAGALSSPELGVARRRARGLAGRICRPRRAEHLGLAAATRRLGRYSDRVRLVPGSAADP